MNKLTLYSYFRRSASFRVRIALNLKGLEYEQVGIHLLRDGGQQLLAPYRKIYPDGLVPSLVDSSVTSAVALNQSLAIIEYIDECFPMSPLPPATRVDRAYVRSVALQVACDIHPLNNLKVLKYLQQTYMNAPYASLSIRDDAKVKIAPVHSDCKCSFWLRSLMGSAG